MDHKIQYLNTDLELNSAEDFTTLATALKTGGVCPMFGVTHGEDGKWYANCETREDYAEPEPNIAAMLIVIESLPSQLQTTWANCLRREFNIGYDCGDEPWAFNQGLSSALLGRIAAVGASLRITIYPDRE